MKRKLGDVRTRAQARTFAQALFGPGAVVYTHTEWTAAEPCIVHVRDAAGDAHAARGVTWNAACATLKSATLAQYEAAACVEALTRVECEYCGALAGEQCNYDCATYFD